MESIKRQIEWAGREKEDENVRSLLGMGSSATCVTNSSQVRYQSFRFAEFRVPCSKAGTFQRVNLLRIQCTQFNPRTNTVT